MPIVSGNVSLYNETDGQAILPTPTIGAVGLIAADEDRSSVTPARVTWRWWSARTGWHLGQSALLAEVFNRADGDPPPVDLASERRNGDFIRANRAWIKACTDLSDGGLALAAFEMAAACGVGVYLNIDDTAALFGEDQGRYLVACNFDQAEALMIAAGRAGVTVETVGRFTGSDVRLGNASAPLAELANLYRSALAEHFA